MEFAKLTSQAPGTPQVIPGIFLHESRMDINSHLDLPQIMNLRTDPSKPTDFGTIDLWAFKRKADVPFMAMNITNQNIVPIDGNTYTFNLATAMDNSTYVVEDTSGTDKPGYGGAPFTLTLSNNKIGAFGSRVKFDLTSTIELEVVAEPRRKGEHYQYTFKFVPSFTGEEFVPKAYLQQGSRLYKLAAFRNREFGQEYDSWAVGSNSMKKFINYVTTAEVQTHYHITREAARFSDGSYFDAGWVKKTYDRVMEYIQIDGAAENGITYLEDYMKTNSNMQGQKIGFQALASLYDDISIGLLAKECSNYMIWGSGGMTALDGLDQQVAAPGLWFQLDYSGYKRFFDIDTFSVDVLIAAWRDFVRGKVDTPQLGNEPLVRVRTGRGGFELFSKAGAQYLYADAVVGQMQTNTKDLNILEGNAATGGIKFNKPIITYFRVPLVAVFEVVMDNSLDPVEANPLVNPYYKGYRLSSYSMIIEDYNTSSSNIKILRPTDYGAGKVNMEVINHSWSHPMFTESYKGTRAHAGTSLRTGFEAYFTTTPDTVWVQDPTKLLKLVPKNPLLPNNGL